MTRLGWPFGDLAPGRYRVILADPPWQFLSFTDAHIEKKPERHYRVMPLDAIAALPVAALAADAGAALVLWATFPLLLQAAFLMKAWGFAYKTGGAWNKMTVNGKRAFGTGYILRSDQEPYLIGTRGGIALNDASAARRQRNSITAPRGRHSEKPEEMHDKIEALYPGPYCEPSRAPREAAGTPGATRRGRSAGRTGGW